MAALLAQSTQLAQPTAQDDGDALALRYGAEVSLRGARGLGLSVAPVREADDVVFEAAVGGLNLGAADERFVVCNAMVRDDKGPVRHGDAAASGAGCRGRCLGSATRLAGEDEARLCARSSARRARRCCPRRTRPAARAAGRGAATSRSGDSVNLRAARGRPRRRAGAAGADDAAELGRGGADVRRRRRGCLRRRAPALARWLDDRPRRRRLARGCRAVEVGAAPRTILKGTSPRTCCRRWAGGRAAACGGPRATGGCRRRERGRSAAAAGAGAARRRATPSQSAGPLPRRGALRAGAGAHAAAGPRGAARVPGCGAAETVVRAAGRVARPAATCRDASVALDGRAARPPTRRRRRAVVDALADAARDARDADAKRVLTSLAEAAAAPYLQALRRWCVDGQLDDPYGEFCVAEDVDAEKTAVARDYNASYWDERFTSDVGKAAGGAVKSHLAKVLTAGKYRVVLRDAACSGEDNELEATWAALTPADVVEDAAGRLARDRPGLRGERGGARAPYSNGSGAREAAVLKRFFLAGQGDFLANFLDLADAELRKPAQRRRRRGSRIY